VWIYQIPIILEKYLNILLNNELLKIDGSYYFVTWKGKDFLEKYDDFMARCRKINKEIEDGEKEKKVLENLCLDNE